MIPPVFILVRPQMGENIGAAARAMLNFGLERMRVVGPRDGWPNPKAVAMASGAGRVLDQAGLFADLAGAVAGRPEWGGLAKADQAGLGIEYMYAFSTSVGDRAIVIIRFTDPDRAIAELQKNGINVIAAVRLLKA
mgnify:CR=1 FL=1